jgi:nucleotide-binding universal stress UspA family protein
MSMRPTLSASWGTYMSGILFATHGNATADGAGRIAALVASRFGVTLTTACVLEPPRILDGGFAPAYVPSPEEVATVRSSFRSLVAEQMRRCGVTGTLQMRTGSASMEIAMAAREMNADLIVLGLGRHGIIDRALGDETALQLVQIASVPVLAVPDSMKSLPKHILAATDLSPTSIASAKATAKWLTKGDVLHLVYVAGEWHGGFPLEQRVSAENVLSTLATRIEAPEGVVIESSVVEGDPATRLLELATTTMTDLLVLGSHGYGFWKRLTIGSVASKIMRLTQAAVYVTPIGCIGAAATLGSVRAPGIGSMASR